MEDIADWFLTCGPHCSCPKDDGSDYVAASFGSDPDDTPEDDCPARDSLDDDEHVDRLVAMAEAAAWMEGGEG